MPRRIAVANQKGGVGKTTTCVNLAAALTAAGARTLLIDCDPQGNATMGAGINKNTLDRGEPGGPRGGAQEWLMDHAAFEAVARQSPAGFTVVAANGDLTAAEVKLLTAADRSTRLRSRLEAADAGFDFVLMDCPPSLNVLTLNALMAAQGVLIPMQCEYYALEGLTALLLTIGGVRRRGNPGLAIEGILRTMYDPRNRLSRDVARQLLKHFGAQVFRTVIPRNVKLAEAPSHGLPVGLYDPHCAGARAYSALAAELAGRARGAAMAATAGGETPGGSGYQQGERQ